MSLFVSFQALPSATSDVDFSARRLQGTRDDFLAKAGDGSPVFLLSDSSAASYSPAIELQHLSVRFHSTCRVTFGGGVVEDQFAVISCDASVPELHEIFVCCLAAAAEQLPEHAHTTDLQRCLQSLLDLFRALGRPSSREVSGLWAELFVIAKSKNVDRALSVWRADPFERFDFSWPSGCIEVKASVKELRQHEFSLEQLRPPYEGMGCIASVLLQPLSGGVGVSDLAGEIDLAVRKQPRLREKLWANIASALGSDFSERLDRRFDLSYAQQRLAVFAMSDVPAPEQPSDPRISGVRFRADLTTAVTTLNGDPRAFLDSFLS